MILIFKWSNMGIPNLGNGHESDLVFVGRERKGQAVFTACAFARPRGCRETKMVFRLPQVLGNKTIWSRIEDKLQTQKWLVFQNFEGKM